MGRDRLFMACIDWWFRSILHAMGRGRLFVACSVWWFRPILHAMGRGRRPAAPDENDDENEKRGIPDNPPQQHTQGKNTPCGNPLTPMKL